VCAQRALKAKGVSSLQNKLTQGLPEANFVSVTDLGKVRKKSSTNEQELQTRPTRWEELAQHSEVPSFSRESECSGWMAEDSGLTIHS